MTRIGTFDNRYRYDHIYPRGRSGETLRGWDTLDNDRPVVIKRPAPQDAPPLRAAQEASIRIERKVLERLTGHPVLTEMRGGGTFRVGGQTHEYIVMDRAEGVIVADMVLQLAQQGERVPVLEMLVIVDKLLDLIAHAHDHQIVYNDVDAKHLFWNREQYRLKIIDWGNAVLLDEGGSHTVTRQTDVFQVGELLFYILTGGKRLDSETTPDGEYAVIFGEDAVHISAALQAVITKATQPSLRKRFNNIVELRQKLREIRQPLEDRRNTILSEVQRGLASFKTHQELGDLLERIQEAIELDPGFPESHRLQQAIEAERHRLELQSHIDAGRIYLDNGNWSRAIETMLDLLNEADDQTAPVIRFVIAAAEMLESQQQTAPPAALSSALDELLHGDAQQAGVILATADEPDAVLLAERLTDLLPSVLLMRPPLQRLAHEQSSTQGTLDIIEAILQTRPDTLSALRRQYYAVGETLENLQSELSNERHLALVERAERALTALQAYLQVVSDYVYGDSTRAGDALRFASRIDPQNPYFAYLDDYFEEIHLAVQALASFKPDTDGASLGDWFNRVLNLLTPYGEDIQDRKLHQALNALHQSANLWQGILAAFIVGRRPKDQLAQLAKAIEPFNANIAAWATGLAEKSAQAAHTELLSPNKELAQALVDAYKVWDQGKHSTAAEQAQRASRLARTDDERAATERLHRLGQLCADWLKNGGPNSNEMTDKTERAIVALFLPDEDRERNHFAEQMPTENAYLKTMGRGLVDYMKQSSTLGVRILFLHFTLRGMLSVQEDNHEAAEFWREAALKTLPEGRSNPIFAEFDTHLTGRKLIREVEPALNAIHSTRDLANVRPLLNQPLADQWMGEIQRAMRQLDVAIRSWEDGDFRSARDSFDTVLGQLEAGEQRSHLDLKHLKEWLRPLREAVSTLQISRLKLEEIAHSATVPAPATPNPDIEDVLRTIADTTERTIGTDHSHQVRQWLSTYRDVLATHTDLEMSKGEKLIAFQAHFAGLFIAKHPLYRLFQVWRDTLVQVPEVVDEPPPPPPAPIEADPLVEDEEVVRVRVKPSRAKAQPRQETSAPIDDLPADQAIPTFDDGTPPADLYYEEPRVSIPWGTLVAIGVVIIGVLAFALSGGFGGGGDEDEGDNGRTVVARASDTPTPTATDTPTETPQATNTPQPSPTDTPRPTDAPSPTPTTPPSPTITPSPTDVAPSFGEFPQDVLRSLGNLEPDQYDWNPAWFVPGAGGPWQLGASKSVAGDAPIIVKMSPSFLEALYATDAAQRLLAVEAEMQLTVYDEADIPSGVFFGLGLENENGRRTAAEFRLERTTALTWGINENGTYRERSSVPGGDLRVTIRMERTADGQLTLFANNSLLGQSDALYTTGTRLVPVLYTSGGGVFVVVSDLQFEFSPIQ
ncbi:MAG: hypothetical protein H6673_14995 [Anaerolineales bacterium]|nr:hypothetical protein [Anaerolineales bacterium]